MAKRRTKAEIEQDKQSQALEKRNKAEGKEPADPSYNGPWYQLTANALHSKTYTGTIDLGTYTEPERRKGVVARRIESLKAEGYKNIEVREVEARA